MDKTLGSCILFLIFWSGVVFAKDALNENVISLFPNGKPYNDSGESLAVYPNINYGSGQQKDQIIRGEYLVKLGDCVACHTHKGGQPFAGGLGFNTPFGIIYSTNITPDKKNGIGNWSFQQFKDAVTQGIGPHYYLYPALPYLYFNKITDQDLKDIKAYLDAIPAVAAPKTKNQMYFPFNWRFLQLGWRLLFFEFQKTDGFHYDSHHNAEWNRGAYLVLGLGHCDMCHTPMYHIFSHHIILGAPIRHRHLSGAYVGGFYAPNITQLFMKDISYEDFKKIFLNYRLKEGGPVQGPMYQVVHDSLQYLQEPDLRAIYVYLSSIKSDIPAKPINPGKNTNIGAAIYDRYCAQCHQKGKGPIEGAPRINDTWAWVSLRKAGLEQLLWYTMNGMDGMPIKGTCTDCTEEELRETIQYMLSRSIPQQNYHPKNQSSPERDDPLW